MILMICRVRMVKFIVRAEYILEINSNDTYDIERTNIFWRSTRMIPPDLQRAKSADCFFFVSRYYPICHSITKAENSY
jgi:hypothetical protein